MTTPQKAAWMFKWSNPATVTRNVVSAPNVKPEEKLVTRDCCTSR